MSDPLIISRKGDTLTVREREDGFDMTITGGGNITADEFAKIEPFVAGKPGADAFLVKVAKRMER